MIRFILSIICFSAHVFLYAPWMSQYGFIGITNCLFVGCWIIGGSVHEATKAFNMNKDKVENTLAFNTCLAIFGLSGVVHLFGGFIIGVHSITVSQ